MAHPDLTSHHVNYLIWRYLQESGHADAAVSLQRAWFPDPQNLPFAPYIRTHALVSLVQKGLQYHELESSIDKVRGQCHRHSPVAIFFGPEPFETGFLKTHDAAGTDQPSSPSKVARDRVTNGHPEALTVKRSRKSETNGDESMELDEARSKGTPEPLDGDGDVSMGAEEPEPTFTLTTGSSVGVQITPAKAADLAPDTACLDIGAHVTQTMWRPRDPTVVVAAGDTFCSLWKLSLSSTPVQKKLVDLKGSNSCVSAVAWDTAGEKLAVATYSDLRGTITMYNVNGDAVDLLPEVPRLITGLHWAEDSSQLVVVASDTRISELALWDDTRRPDVFPPPQVIKSPIYDLAWCGRNQVFACGDGSVYQCEMDNSIRLTKTFPSNEPDAAWQFIRCMHTDSSAVAVTACSATATIWIPTHDILIENAHKGDITAIEVRPQAQAQRRNSSIVVASFSTDDDVKVWHVDLESKHFDCLHRLRLGPSLPALTGGFSPDGYALGAASKDRVLIWNVERGGHPMATWAAPGSEDVKEEPDRATNEQNGHAASIGDSALSWDADGKRLAYGFGHQVRILFGPRSSQNQGVANSSQMAIVNLQR
ncbi:hypothetical protein NUU61_008209 [Penicillium alfredii]|uniref:LisH domain-containing protein n=1 Tax=Penicillium alfredii TaxID=1506179 RepID=A0A9W9ERX9_9EURO|nr:uncharacterized protein NUU61_008209 [Penicillium alfredii]KAJ5086902.1 hypothetical protein NUU61_008209 [Penicillium alfredii]